MKYSTYSVSLKFCLIDTPSCAIEMNPSPLPVVFDPLQQSDQKTLKVWRWQKTIILNREIGRIKNDIKEVGTAGKRKEKILGERKRRKFQIHNWMFLSPWLFTRQLLQVPEHKLHKKKKKNKETKTENKITPNKD